MDTLFDTTLWRPTKPPEPGDKERTPDEIATLCAQLRHHTKKIIAHPYDPANWSRRASTLHRLRYPELAVGDAHKASLLCRAHIQRLEASEDTRWWLGCGMGFWMLDPLPHHQLRDGFDEVEDRGRLGQFLGRLQARANKIERRNLYFSPVFEEGRFRRRMYPWMLGRHRRRSEGLVERLNGELRVNGANIEVGRPFCVVKKDAFGEGEDVLGVFAARGIYEGEIILIDETAVWGCNLPRTLAESEKMKERKLAGGSTVAEDHLQERPVDLSWIPEEVGKQAGPVLLNCRLLLSGINDGIEHPLDHHLIARLTPTYHEDKIDTFVLLNDIAIPNKALQQFGIDIFANLNYDTWVLLTIQARVLNNSCGDLMAESLNPLFALFNHSCEPNVEWSTTAEDHRTILVRARSNVQKNEQLLVEYDQFMRDQPLEVRRKRMFRWLAGPCRCTRCVRDEEAMKGRVRVDEVLWDDIPDKAVFPEDLLKN